MYRAKLPTAVATPMTMIGCFLPGFPSVILCTEWYAPGFGDQEIRNVGKQENRKTGKQENRKTGIRDQGIPPIAACQRHPPPMPRASLWGGVLRTRESFPMPKASLWGRDALSKGLLRSGMDLRIGIGDPFEPPENHDSGLTEVFE